MSKEVFEMLCAMNRRDVELQIALQCAPTIAGLKPSNLFIVSTADEGDAADISRRSGLSVYRLAYDRHRVVFLVFNRISLTNYITRSDVSGVLKEYGYKTINLGYVLRIFQSRYCMHLTGSNDFPHEMGLLLGYPVEDVTGFIENGGRNFLLSGYWKVYHDAEKKRVLFKQYDDVKDEAVKLVCTGHSIGEIVDILNHRLPSIEAV